MPRFAVLVVLIIASSSAFADVNEEIVACSNTGSTIQINECAANLAAREDARMKDELTEATAVLRRVEKFFAAAEPRPNLVQPLQIAQAAWIKYREAQCQLQIELAMGGSIGGLNYQGCLASLNHERLERLRSLRVEYESFGY